MMVVNSTNTLFLITVYGWWSLINLGYHGLFSCSIICFWILCYWNLWELNYLWTYEYYYEIEVASWCELGNQIINDIIITIDVLSLGLAVVMSGGSAIVVSFVYLEMWDEKEGINFGIALLAFISFMLVLTGSNNFVVFYLGWEGIGLTSLFLINFWVERIRSFKSTLKVFTINKIGDFLVTICICSIISLFGILDFGFLHGFSFFLLNWLVIYGEYMIGFLDIFILITILGGGVKSAQYGFHIWLLEAMEAPLGASALMHSSTLVVAGIVLIFRLNSTMQLSVSSTNWIILWGCWTAGFAAFIACYQFELKIVLAYSTISSMGFIYCLLGLNTIIEGLLYLIIHAFTKIFLFLIVGLIMFYCVGCQDFRWMGNLLLLIPILWVFIVSGGISMAGLPYWSGYYCKAKLWAAVLYNNFNWYSVRLIILFITFLTYIYLSRLSYNVFGGFKRAFDSIYTIKWISLFSISLFSILTFIILFSGVLWEDFLISVKDTYLVSWQILIFDYSPYSVSIERFGWIGLLVILVIFLVLVLVLFSFNINQFHKFKENWLKRMAISITILVLWC